ncbi:MAG: hypothetical protein EOP46_12890 [Sphingobacteriaceae bacterium]|nr:MAG: hypothetical protein EOP46_12890 [Sphingobacteriaceae bacterium]
MAEQLLIEQDGEFHPIAGSIDMEGNFTYEALNNGDDFPLSETLISDFKSLFDERFKEEIIKAYAIAYDVRVTSSNYPDKIDAIAIFVKHVNKQPINYFYPYSLKNSEIEFYKPWGVHVDDNG